MTKNALVLGGGGALGVAWETGLLAGLREAGIDPAGADLIVGTSAGSIVGTCVAAGKLDEGLAQQSQAEDPAITAMIVPHGFGLLATTEERAAATLLRVAFVFLPLTMSASVVVLVNRRQCRDSVSGHCQRRAIPRAR